jgi:hypothetical protein
MDGMDRLASPYVRYMDDFIFWSNNKDSLLRLRNQVEDFANLELGLELKQRPIANRTHTGMDFLGFRVFPSRIALSRTSARRYVSRVRGIVQHCPNEKMAQMRLTSMTAFVMQADTHAWRTEKLKRI